MNIQLVEFKDIASDLAAGAFHVRRVVFIEEQQVEEDEEFDEFDKTSLHFAALVDGNVVGTARYRETGNGIKLERFAVLKEYRRKGIADKLMKIVLEKVLALHRPVYLHAQLEAVPFYEKNGFLITGSRFMECNIPHYKMVYAQHQTDRITLTVQDALNHVRDFHDAFRIGNEERPKAQIGEKDYQLRYRLMKEENDEYLEAAKRGDLVEVADALGDMFYILCGTVLKHGLQDKFADIFEEIQRSNMSKLDKDGNPIYREDGKVLKSELYFKPDIAALLKGHL